MEFDKIVHKLSKADEKIIDIIDIGRLIDDDYPDVDTTIKTKVYRATSRLKDLEVITPIRHGLYVVWDRTDDVDLYIDDHYWKFAKKIITRTTGAAYFIAGHKSLELHQMNHEPPEILTILTPKVSKILTLSPTRKIHFQMVTSKEGKNLFTTYHKMSQVEDILGTQLRTCCQEQALLESLIKRKGIKDFDLYVVDRFLKRYHKHLRKEVLFELVSTKYITPINRLRELAKKGKYDELYDICLTAIKVHGKGCFISTDI